MDEKYSTTELIKFIWQRESETVTTRVLIRSGPCYPSAAHAKAVLDELVAMGLGEWQHIAPGPQGGRPRREFALTTLAKRAVFEPDDIERALLDAVVLFPKPSVLAIASELREVVRTHRHAHPEIELGDLQRAFYNFAHELYELIERQEAESQASEVTGDSDETPDDSVVEEG